MTLCRRTAEKANERLIIKISSLKKKSLLNERVDVVRECESRKTHSRGFCGGRAIFKEYWFLSPLRFCEMATNCRSLRVQKKKILFFFFTAIVFFAEDLLFLVVFGRFFKILLTF